VGEVFFWGFFIKAFIASIGVLMAERMNQQASISVEEILKTEIIVNQALIDILIAKQLITEEELVDSIRNIRQEQKKMLNDSNKIVSLKR
jgi:hypothetical protein